VGLIRNILARFGHNIDCLWASCEAIRSNVGDIEYMKKAIYAVLFHVSSSQKNKWHDQCPDGEKKLRDKACGTKTYILPEVVCRMSSVFVCNCFHGKTQNHTCTME